MLLVLPDLAALDGVHAAIANIAKIDASQLDGFRDGGITVSSSVYLTSSTAIIP
jgi:hypothetical protein